MRRKGYAYVMASLTRRLYIGVTSDLGRRATEHRYGLGSEFAARYNINRLVYFEEFDEVTDAIAREKQLKGLTRAKKIALIERDNPGWDDLFGRVHGMRPQDLELADRLAAEDRSRRRLSPRPSPSGTPTLSRPSS